MTDHRLTFGSLFAGVGGIDLGLEATGRWSCRFQVEWDRDCQQTLAYWWPYIPRWGDVAETSGTELPPVDLITFGSPCQDLSVAGKRAGLEGGRSSMFFEAIRIIKEMRDVTNGTFPRYALWENVAGALTSNRGRDFGVVLDSLADIGAVAIEWHLVDSQFFGVPQRRRRVFVLACFDPSALDRGGREILPIGEGRRRNTPSRRSSREGATGPSPSRSGDSGEHLIGSDLVGPLCARDWSIGSQYVNMNKLVVDPIGIVGVDRRDDVRVYEEPVQTLTSKMGTGGGNVPLIYREDDVVPIQDGRDIEKRQNGLGIGEEGDPSYTLDTTGAQAVAYDEAILFQQNQRDEVRIMPGYAGSLAASPGMKNTNYVLQPTEDAPIYSFDTLFGSNATVCENQSPPLTVRSGPSVLTTGDPFVFQPGSMVRLGSPGSHEVAPTLRAEGKGGDNMPHVLTSETRDEAAYGIQATIIGRQDHNGPQGSGITPEDGPMFTLNTIDRHAVAIPESVVIRRLTPIECERLQGWPDNHTLYRADGRTNADTARYRMTGNGVTASVAEWIGRHLAIADDESRM